VRKVSYNYENGKFSLIPIQYSEKKHLLTIEKRQGDFTGMLETRTFEIVWISKEKPSKLDFEAKPDAVLTYDGSKPSIQYK